MMRSDDKIRRWAAVLVLLLAGVAGCSEQAAAPADSSARVNAPMTGGAAVYGVNVEISFAGAAGQLGDDAMVYAFLRKPGTRMPLAVQHFAGRALPKRVSFAGGAEDGAVELVVRLSPSGRVDRSPEDIEVVEPLPGLRHPPQTVSVVLGAADPTSSPRLGAQHEVAAPVAKIRAAVRIEEGHPFPEDAVVFVIARKPGQSMPSAVRRLAIADLPAEIELTDADAMMFSSRLSDAERLDLFARVSSSGTAAQSSTDWLSDVVRLETSQMSGVVQLSMHEP